MPNAVLSERRVEENLKLQPSIFIDEHFLPCLCSLSFPPSL